MPAAYDAVGADLPAGALDRWWLLYGDPQLQGLVDQALAGGFSVREAFARLTEARATRASALSRYGLQGNAQASGEVRQTDYISTSDLVGRAGDPLAVQNRKSVDLFEVIADVDGGRGRTTFDNGEAVRVQIARGDLAQQAISPNREQLPLEN